MTSVIAQLQRAEAYPHPVAEVEVIETHISWVLLAGEFAYKIKKPLDLGFLDFRRLDRRRFFCDEELRLNRHWAPSLYLDVVPVTRTAGALRIGGDGEAVEYAVRMRRFDQASVLDAQLEAGLLTAADLRELAGRLAHWHATAKRTPVSDRAQTLALATQLMRDNFAPLERALAGVHDSAAAAPQAGDRQAPASNADDPGALRALRDWTETQLDTLGPTLARRFDEGYFRACHGDLHLGNLVRLADGITPFDCIEFDAGLRHSDVIADCAFLTMDLTARGQPALAAQFLNRYLECGGDYDGVRVYTLYVVYRCLVRAKIAVLRSAERHTAGHRSADLDEARRYIAMARQQTLPRRPLLIAMHGFSAAGKSYVARELMLRLPALRLRSDVERKRMQGLAESAASDSGVGAGLYGQAVTDRLYARLGTVARTLLCAGHNVILDAAFLARATRDDARVVAQRSAARFVVCDVVADESVLRQRIAARQARGDDPSEADVQVLEHQIATHDPLGNDERDCIVRCRSDEDPARLIERLAAG